MLTIWCDDQVGGINSVLRKQRYVLDVLDLAELTARKLVSESLSEFIPDCHICRLRILDSVSVQHCVLGKVSHPLQMPTNRVAFSAVQDPCSFGKEVIVEFLFDGLLPKTIDWRVIQDSGKPKIFKGFIICLKEYPFRRLFGYLNAWITDQVFLKLTHHSSCSFCRRDGSCLLRHFDELG